MRVLVVIAADAGYAARRIAVEQARAFADLGLSVEQRELESDLGSLRADVDVVHLHPGPSTSVATAEALAAQAPLFLHLFDPARVGALLAPVAQRVLVPSRMALVHLVDQVQLAPRQARILAPGTHFVGQKQSQSQSHSHSHSQSRSRGIGSGSGPLGLLHLGPRGAESGLEDLIRALVDLPPGSVGLRAAGPGSPEGDRRLQDLAGDLPLQLGPSLAGASAAKRIRGSHAAVFPSRVRESYALLVDDALALGLPVWIAGGEAARERYDASALTTLPTGDPHAWQEVVLAWLGDPNLARAAYESLPDRVPSTLDAAQVLVRWSRELTPQSSELQTPVHRRPA